MQSIYVFFIATFMLLAGCGNSGGGTSTGGVTAYRVVLATQGTLTTGALAGLGVTLQLPAGVTPKLAVNGTVDSSVVVTSGVLANNASVHNVAYTPASGALPGTLSFILYSTAAEGFGIGEFATVTLNISGLTVDFATVNQNITHGIMLPVATLISASTVDVASYALVDSISITLTAEAI